MVFRVAAFTMLMLVSTWGGPLLRADDKPAAASDQPAAAPASADHPAAEKTAAEKPAAEKTDHTAQKPAAAHPADEHAKGHDDHGAAAHGGGHHDATDLGHQNAGPDIEDPSQWKSDLAICTFLVFLCLLALLSKFAWQPIMDGLAARERGIAANIEEAKRSADKAAEQLRHYEAKLTAAAEEAREIVAQARRDADSARERILAEAQEASQRERQRAIEDINAAKTVALQEMTQKSVDLAVTLAGRMIQKQLRPEDHAQLIREALGQFPSRN